MKITAIFYSLAIMLLLAGTASADSQVDQYIEKMDKINFLPGLLPVIIENRDAIELTDAQLDKLIAWREAHSKQLHETRNKIVQKRMEIKQAALSPDISSARLIQLQNETFRLQRELLEYKLSCRELVLNTFNQNNWEGFFMVLAEDDAGITLPEFYITSR